MELIDTHLHLDATEFEVDRDLIVQAALHSGVTRFVLPAVEISNCAAVRTLAMGLPGSVYAFGIHPLYVAHATDGDLAKLEGLLGEGGACAVGEIGMDAYVADADLSRQEFFFIAQLKLARKFDLPVLLHIRRAQDRILGLLRRYPVRGGIAHAFNGSLQQAEAYIKLGFKLGFGGAMTYSGSTRIRKLAASLPLASIVLESDAPDIPPEWARGQRNVPANVAKFATILAELRGMSVVDVAAATTHNANDIVKLL